MALAYLITGVLIGAISEYWIHKVIHKTPYDGNIIIGGTDDDNFIKMEFYELPLSWREGDIKMFRVIFSDSHSHENN